MPMKKNKINSFGLTLSRSAPRNPTPDIVIGTKAAAGVGIGVTG